MTKILQPGLSVPAFGVSGQPPVQAAAADAATPSGSLAVPLLSASPLVPAQTQQSQPDTPMFWNGNPHATGW